MGLADSIGAVVGGLLGKGPVSAPDLAALFKTIDAAGAEQKNWINALPAELQKQYETYKASNAGAADTLKSTIADSNQKFLADEKAIYDPNSPAVKAALDAAKKTIYADLPGQQDAIREALAASGGFGRGTASKQLAAPVLQAASKFSQSVSNITADQLMKQQAATQAAIEKIKNVDDATANTLFGMSREQALQILTSGRTDLKDQLSTLINQSQAQTNQTLATQGVNIQNQWNQKVAENADYNNKVNGWVNLGTNVATAAAPGFLSALNSSPVSSAPANYNPNMAPNQAAIVGY